MNAPAVLAIVALDAVPGVAGPRSILLRANEVIQ